MSEVTYAVVFSGGILEGFALISVKAHMAKMLKVDATKMASLFSGKPVVIKRTGDKAEALRIGGALKKAGADISVKVIKAPVTTPAASTSTSTTASTTASTKAQDTSQQAPVTGTPKARPNPSFDLAPNVGNLFEAPPAPAPVNVDISALALADNDNSPLQVPKVVPKLEVDLSALHVSENDGSPLAAPAPLVEKVQAPDFTLDAPGAVLETIKDDRVPVNPDVSGISLAFPGGDLLNPEERDNTPTPTRPDVSKITLKSSF
jgi:LysM repeat protein